MSEPIRNSNDDTGRFMRTLVAWEDEGNAEFDREHDVEPRPRFRTREDAYADQVGVAATGPL